MSDNLDIYKSLRTVPDSAKKKIGGGRLKGFTDVNPMWRIKALTNQFGACGFGWKYEIKDQRIEKSDIECIAAAFITIDLYVKVGATWSEAIPGVGGSEFVLYEKGKFRMSDDCFKMALTDAISVAGKALGLAGDVYYEKDKTKYSDMKSREEEPLTESEISDLYEWLTAANRTEKAVCEFYKINSFADIDRELYKRIIPALKATAGKS